MKTLTSEDVPRRASSSRLSPFLFNKAKSRDGQYANSPMLLWQTSLRLDRLIPALARLKNRGEGWDLTPVITAALRLVGKADKENRHLEDWLGQTDLLESDPDKKRPAVQAVIDTDTAGHHFYNHELSEIKKLDSAKLDRTTKAAVTGQNQALSVLSLIQTKLGVNNDKTILLQDNGNKRGSVRILSDTYLVSLFEDADLSTLLHETGHIFFEEMKKLVESGHADEAMLKDYNTMRSWLGAKEGEELTVEQREQAARGFEAWLMEGNAPSRELKSAFGRFKKWLLAIYRKAANLNVELTDDLNSLTI